MASFLTLASVLTTLVIVHSAPLVNEKVAQKTGGFSYENRGTNGKGAIRLIGNVQDVLNGRVLDSFLDNYWPAPKIGFGAGTVRSIYDLGEAFYANGHAFIRAVDNSTPEYFQTVTNKTFRASFSVVLPNSLKPDGIASYKSSDAEAISWGALYTSIYNAVGTSPYCFYGFVDFVHVNALAASKAAVYGEYLFGPARPTYYTQPNFNLTNVHGLAFGCAANYSAFNDQALHDQLNKALYLNPLDTGATTALQNHAHFISLDPSVKNLADVNPSVVTGVYHLLTDTTIKNIKAHVFKIDDVNKFVSIDKAPASSAGY